MKKLLYVALCVVFAMSVLACKSEKVEDVNKEQVSELQIDLGENAGDSEDTKEPEATKEPEQEPTKVPAEEVTSEPEPTKVPELTKAPEPGFDTSWAGNSFEMLMPQPPKGENGWETEQLDDSTYRITTYGPNLNVSVFMEYVNSLPAYGFTVEEMIEDYMYVATDANGNTVKLVREADVHQYTVTKK